MLNCAGGLFLIDAEFHVTGFAVHICCMILLYLTTSTGLLVHLRRHNRSCSSY